MISIAEIKTAVEIVYSEFGDELQTYVSQQKYEEWAKIIRRFLLKYDKYKVLGYLLYLRTDRDLKDKPDNFDGLTPLSWVHRLWREKQHE